MELKSKDTLFELFDNFISHRVDQSIPFSIATAYTLGRKHILELLESSKSSYFLLKHQDAVLELH